MRQTDGDNKIVQDSTEIDDHDTIEAINFVSP